MSLNDLSAAELRRIDSVCLRFESELRKGRSPSIDDWVERYGEAHADVLRGELTSVHDELSGSGASVAPPGSSPFGTLASSSLATVSLGSSGRKRLPEPGTTIGPYLIEDTLGRGGMGVVFKAIDDRLRRRVAIKMLSTEVAERRDLNERFEREARAIAGISHPNIVELFDVGSSAGMPYVVMEYLDGESLDQRFARQPLSIGEVHRFGAQIADALSTAHAAGVVHRDLKPQNIMLVRRGSEADDTASPAESDASTIVKLFDFGLSRVPRESLAEDAEETHEGMILGTPGYMAPEQARGRPVTPAADIFALGCVLFEAFYGSLAFEGKTKSQRLTSTINDMPAADPKRRRDDVALAALIDQCLQKDSSQRPSSAALIAKQLRHGSGIESVSSVAAAVPATRWSRRRTIAIVAALGGAAITLPSTWWFAGMPWSPNSPSDRLRNIRSIAVLSFRDQSSDEASDQAEDDASKLASMQPVGDKPLHRGEEIAALLVHELSRMPRIRVPRFRPVNADTAAEVRELGQRLEVDALLDGTMRDIKVGEIAFLELDVQLLSTETGDQLWGRKIQTQASNSLLEQSRLATQIAEVVGQSLTSTAAELAPPTTQSFRCLVDGDTRSDPDSVAGLTMALRCFEAAHRADPRFADPLAGIALTAITLAGQSTAEKTPELVQQARQRVDAALRRDPASVDARLANAMLDWQTVGRYETADRSFRELVTVAPNRWQVHHQYGLLQLATNRTFDAAQSLREASLLNPMSMIVKVDRARAAWFSGDTGRAIDDAKDLIDRYDNHFMARGLLIDIYESQSRFREAIALHDSFDANENPSEENYFLERKQRLIELPYGPFGERCNQSIWQCRTLPMIESSTLAGWVDPMPPMFALLLAAHPSFNRARTLDRADEILPPGVASVPSAQRTPVPRHVRSTT